MALLRAAVADRANWLARPGGRTPHRGDVLGVSTNHRAGRQRWLQIKEATKTRIEQTIFGFVIRVLFGFGVSCRGVKTCRETEPSEEASEEGELANLLPLLHLEAEQR
jgi:hypothetical protein